MTKLSTILLLALTLFAPPSSAAGEVDLVDSCADWAERGECDVNPRYMLKNCAKSCAEHDEHHAQDLRETEGIHDFYDLIAKDIDGNELNFKDFMGKVVIVVNVASHCGFTESHYEGLVELHKEVSSTGKVEILAFPCNQFGKQEPEECPKIKEFAKNKGVEFTMMDKIDVNGKNASLVYKYLKKQAGVQSISWNFATYFVISPDGEVNAFHRYQPMQLKDVVFEMLEKEL